MSIRTGQDTTAQQSGVGRKFSVTTRRNASSLVCGLLVAAGGTGLLVTTGAQTTDKSMSRALASVKGGWGASAVPSRGNELAPATTPVSFDDAQAKMASTAAGDEGFWLSARALSGNATGQLALGDPITLAKHHYVVSELTPLAGLLTKTADAKASRGLTLVVATEVGTESTPSPRRLRFLIDSPTREPIAPQPAVAVRAQGSL